jgi:hypothetical protein
MVVMEVVVVDRTNLAKKKKDGPSKAMLSSILLLVLPCLGPVGLET